MEHKHYKLVFQQRTDGGPPEIVLNDQHSLTLGRSHDNFIQLADSSVSRQHAALKLTDHQWFLEDLQSHNGTVLNGTRIEAGRSYPVKARDVIQLGIYQMEWVEVLPDTPPVNPGRQSQNAPDAPQPADPLPDEHVQIDLLSDAELDEDDENRAPPRVSFARPLMMFVALALVLAGLYTYWLYRAPDDQSALPPAGLQTDDDTDHSQEQTHTPSAQPLTPYSAESHSTVTTLKPEPMQSLSHSLLLNVTCEPDLPAKIMYGGKEVGVCPFSGLVDFEASGQTQKIDVVFDLPVIHSQIKESVTIEVGQHQPGEAVSLAVKPRIAAIVFRQLPKYTTVGLQVLDQDSGLSSQYFRIDAIRYDEPVYVPVGAYALTLNRTDSNGVPQPIYQRKIELKAGQSSVIAVEDSDLKLFALIVDSNPDHATVLVDGVKMGQTPLQKKLLLGEHQIQVVRDGYDSQTTTVTQSFNVEHRLTVTLERNRFEVNLAVAQDQLVLGQVQQALETVTSALNQEQLTPKQRAKAFDMLGQIAGQQNDFEAAGSFFGQAKKLDQDYFFKSGINESKMYHRAGQTDRAIQSLVEVMANLNEHTPEDIRSLAKHTFEEIAAGRSVIFVVSDPAGASLKVNDRAVEGVTPLILTDLNLGNYRFEFHKEGYKDFATQENIKIGEFVVVRVSLDQK